RRAATERLSPGLLPQRRTDRNIEIVLTEFLVEKETRTNRGFSVPLAHLFFQIAENGSFTTNWRLAKIHATDQAGNQSSHEVLSQPTARREEYWSGLLPLFPDEPAWKLNLEFKRRTDSGETRTVEMVVKPRITSNRVAPQW